MTVRDTFQRELLGRKRRAPIGGALLGLALALSAGAADDRRAVGGTRTIDPPTPSREQALVWMTIGAKRFAVSLEDNPTASAFVQLLPAVNAQPAAPQYPRNNPAAAAQSVPSCRGIPAGILLLSRRI